MPDKDLNDFLKWISKHIVPIRFVLVRGRDKKEHLISAFPLSIKDQWILMTAGHCITEIAAIRATGYEISICELVDNLGSASTCDSALPINWDAATPTVPFTDPNLDYGVIFVHDFWRRALERNGVQALNEEVWDKQPGRPELFFLCGVPAELNPPTGRLINDIASSLHVVTPLAERPDGFAKTDAPMFYGSVQLTAELSNLRGLSGAPVFSMQRMEDGLRYWLHAMQVTANPFGNISACLIKPFATFLREIGEGAYPLPPSESAGT